MTCVALDCFAEPVIGARVRADPLLAMTNYAASVFSTSLIQYDVP
jgi:hypothetical protein